MTKFKQLVIAASVLAAATAPALAQVDRSAPPQPSDRAYERPQEQATPSMQDTERRQGTVDFITGGVGKDESERFRAMMPRYALGLEFGRANAARADFLSNVDVTVTDARGNQVLQAVSKGPFLLANLPAGQYNVRVANDGQVKSRNVTVTPGSHQHLAFTW